MKAILIEDVKKIGKKGDVVNVKSGYFRNYLQANNLAVIANKDNLKDLEAQKKDERQNDLKNRENALALKEKIENAGLTIMVKAGEEGKLFGSVTNKNIAEELAKKGIEVDKKKITIDENIVELGKYKAKIKLYTDITAEAELSVEAE